MKQTIDNLCLRVVELLQDRTTLARQLEAVTKQLEAVTRERDELRAMAADPRGEAEDA